MLKVWNEKKNYYFQGRIGYGLEIPQGLDSQGTSEVTEMFIDALTKIKTNKDLVRASEMFPFSLMAHVILYVVGRLN